MLIQVVDTEYYTMLIQVVDIKCALTVLTVNPPPLIDGVGLSGYGGGV